MLAMRGWCGREPTSDFRSDRLMMCSPPSAAPPQIQHVCAVGTYSSSLVMVGHTISVSLPVRGRYTPARHRDDLNPVEQKSFLRHRTIAPCVSRKFASCPRRIKSASGDLAFSPATD